MPMMWFNLRILTVSFMITVTGHLANGQLSANFYDSRCPNMENVVQQVVSQKFKGAGPIAASATVRLFFHDCFVEGCDGSVLLSSTPGNVAERDATPNLSLGGDGFDTVVQAKNILEQQCPGVVSCADILAVAARDFVALAGGPTWVVKKGRRDGRVSMASHAVANLPDAKFNVDQLASNFASKGLSLIDLVALSGAHTIGFSHCDQFTKRLYNFNSTFTTDPSLDASLAANLKQACPKSGGDPNAVQAFDVTTPFLFDNAYYSNLRQGKGLITSDEVLFTDVRTRSLVTRYAKKHLFFFTDFARAMDRMGSIQVKTGAQGEIRRVCSSVNS